jgi:tetratricopeptide (TPR) repeat protein
LRTNKTVFSVKINHMNNLPKKKSAQKPKTKTPDLNLSKSQKIAFKAISFLVPFLILFILEIILRLAGYGDNFSLFIQNPDKDYKAYEIVNPEVGKKYFQKFEYTRPANDIFLKKKAANTFRIFVMGSSTVIGFPYDKNLMFTRILDQRLQDAFPGKQIEVVNTAITAINSYTLLDFIDQILDKEPDAILIYAGQNEYYGAFGVGSNETMSKYSSLTMLHLKLKRFRFYQLMSNSIQSISRAVQGTTTAPKVRGTLMKRIVNKKDIVLGGKDYTTGIDQYRKNLGKILKKAEQKHVPVFIADLVTNVKDLAPFGSIASPGQKSAAEVYQMAVQSEKTGDFKTAKELYYKAKDLDCVRFRAPSEINNIIRESAKKYNALFVPMLSAFEAKSPHELVGNNLLVEHVHPNIAGYFLMADVFFQEILKSKLIDKSPDLYHLKSSEYYKKNWGYTAFDSLLGYHRIQNLKYHWPYRDESTQYIDYREIYKPTSLIDSLAFNVISKPDNYAADGHLFLANYYKQKKDYYNAFREYNSIVKINPFISANYTDAASILILDSDLPLALEYFNKSLKYKESFYAYFRAGEIYLIKNDNKNAIRCFESAYKLATKNNALNVLSKLYMAYIYDKQAGKANNVLNTMKSINPRLAKFPVPAKSYEFMNFTPVQIAPYVEKSKEFLAKGKTNEALVSLLTAMDIYDSPILDRYVAEIYISEKDKEKALYYMVKSYPDFNTDPKFLFNMITVYLVNGQVENARQVFNTLKQLEPNSPLIPEIQRIIEGRKTN